MISPVQTPVHPRGRSSKETIMKKLYEALSLLAALLFTACEAPALSIQTTEQPARTSPSYEVVLDKSMTDKAVMDFITNNKCSPADKFQLCKEAGMALWADVNQVVKTVYLYVGGTDGFKRYRGKLPFGLTFYDPMWRVQEKLRKLNTDDSSYDAGLPDEASSPNHIHYWAIYRRLGMTIIYDAPSADQDAYIYAILMNK
jgi:hypothetical protein